MHCIACRSSSLGPNRQSQGHSLHSSTLRRHLHRHHNSTRRERPAGCSAATNKKPSRKCCFRAIRARLFGAYEHDTVIQWSTGGAPETVRGLALCLLFFSSSSPPYIYSTSTLPDVASRLGPGLTGRLRRLSVRPARHQAYMLSGMPCSSSCSCSCAEVSEMCHRLIS